MDNVVEQIWKDIGGDQEEVLSTEKFGGYKTEVKERVEERIRLALRNKVKEEKNSGDIRGVERRYWNENVSARPNGLYYAKKLKLRFRAGNLDLPEERRKIYLEKRKEKVISLRSIPVVGRRGTCLQICAHVAQQ